MGWDIEFHARFGGPEPPVRRFARAFEVMCAQPGIETLWSFEMARSDERVAVKGAAADADLVRGHLGARLDEPGWYVEATWSWQEEVRLDDGTPAVVGDTITIAVPRQTYRLGSETRPELLPPGGQPDMVVNAFDYRRYFPRGGDLHVWWQDLPPEAPACRLARLKIDALMRRLAPIVALGVASLWGMRGGDRFSPATTYAVFHRDPERFRDDGADTPLPDVPITHGAVEEAARRLDYPWVAAAAGPIVYDARLGYGSLESFYWSLAREIEAAARDRG